MKVIINKKSRRPYPHEDEVTSAVFGPLSMLPADQVWLALSTIFRSELAVVFDKDRLDSFRPHRVDFQFLAYLETPNPYECTKPGTRFGNNSQRPEQHQVCVSD